MANPIDGTDNPYSYASGRRSALPDCALGGVYPQAPVRLPTPTPGWWHGEPVPPDFGGASRPLRVAIATRLVEVVGESPGILHAYAGRDGAPSLPAWWEWAHCRFLELVAAHVRGAGRSHYYRGPYGPSVMYMLPFPGEESDRSGDEWNRMSEAWLCAQVRYWLAEPASVMPLPTPVCRGPA